MLGERCGEVVVAVHVGLRPSVNSSAGTAKASPVWPPATSMIFSCVPAVLAIPFTRRQVTGVTQNGCPRLGPWFVLSPDPHIIGGLVMGNVIVIAEPLGQAVRLCYGKEAR
jgi:hypothetical protein